MNSETVPLYYEEVGQGLPIVLLHGYPLNHTIWKPVADLLQDNWQPLANLFIIDRKSVV